MSRTKKAVFTGAGVALMSVVTFLYVDWVHTFGGEIEWRNRSDKELYIVSATGFTTSIECGVLVSNGNAGLSLAPMACPQETTIQYSIERSNEPLQSTVAIRRETGMLVFEYTKDGRWAAYFEKGEHADYTIKDYFMMCINRGWNGFDRMLDRLIYPSQR